MMEPSPEADELVQLLDGLAYIKDLAEVARGLDDVSNAALKSIGKRANQLEKLVRSLDETTMFGPDELARRMEKSPARKSDF